MLSPRRIRLLIIAAILLLVMIFFYSNQAGIQNQRFYRSTVAAIEAHREAKDSPKHHVQPQKPAPSTPAIHTENRDEVEEIPIAGRTKMTIPKNQNQAPKESVQVHVDSEVKNELNGILKRSPIIIFSKSYCPYSGRAKSILLDKYTIVPAPHVVELDQHVLGKQLQALLGKNTGRKTVPNVLVNGKSIGGGDDVTALDEKDELVSTLKNLGGKWIQEVHRKKQDGQA